MVEVILDDEQARIIAGAKGLVPVRDRRGALVGFLATKARPTNGTDSGPLSEDAYLAEVKRRLASEQPRRTTGEVLAYLASLDES